MSKQRYPKGMRLSKETHSKFMKSKPKRMIADQYLEILLNHYDKCEHHSTSYSYRE